jgi:hypothetical protein
VLRRGCDPGEWITSVSWYSRGYGRNTVLMSGEE